MRHYLGPWQRDETPPGGCWVPPPGCVGLIDLRPLPEQALSIPGARPIGLFQSRITLPSEYTLIGHGDTGEIKPAAKDKAAWFSLLGYRPTGTTLAEVILDHLTEGSDPTGDSGSKPLMPDTSGLMDLHLGGRLRSARFEWGRSPHTAKVRAVMQADFAQQWDGGTSPAAASKRSQARRMLDFWAEQHPLADWREFIPANLRADVPGRLKHSTTITDDFTRADGTTIGNLLTWTELLGTWETLSNQIHITTINTISFARAESDLSSADHYAQALIAQLGFTGGANMQVGACARFNAAANTMYYASLIRSSGDLVGLAKVVAGTPTSLASAAQVISAPHTLKCQINGSTLKALVDTVEKHSITDTAVTGNLRTGLYAYRTTMGQAELFDDFEAADLAGAATRMNLLNGGATRGILVNGGMAG